MISSMNSFRFALLKLTKSYSILRCAVQNTAVAKQYHNHYKQRTYLVPTTLCFSLLTLLGLEKEKTPEDELIESIKYSILFIQRSEYDKAERLLHVSLRQAQQMSHQNGITYVYDVMANLALEREHLDKAKKLFVSVAQRLMQNGVTEDDLKIVHISLKLARISHLQKEYQTAQTGFQWCIEKLYKQLKESDTPEVNKLLAMAEDWYGKLYADCNEPEKALQLLLSSRDRTEIIEDFDEEHKVIQLNDIATVCAQLDRFEESERFLREAINKGKDVPEMADFGATYVNLGHLYMKKGMLNEARKNCGFAWRLGNERKSEKVKELALKCMDDVNKAS